MKKYFDTLNAILERGGREKVLLTKTEIREGGKQREKKNDKETLIKNSISRRERVREKRKKNRQ